MTQTSRATAGAAMLMVCISACGTPSTPGSPDASATPSPGAASTQVGVAPGVPGVPRGISATPVDDANPTAVAEAFAAATFSYDTAMDRSPSDAQARSAPFATPSYGAQLRQPLAQGGGARWNDLEAHRGYTTVSVAGNRDDGRAPDTPGTAVRSFTVATTGHSPDTWSAPMGSVLLFLSLVRASAASPWQVQSVQIPEAH